jgi:hypothetical protein
MSCELLDKRFTNYAMVAEKGRSMLRPYEDKNRAN